MGKIKSLGIVCLMGLAASLGDCYNVNDRVVNPVRYRNIKIAPETYQKMFKLQKKYVINENRMLEVHIGHKEEWHKVSKELRVNERSMKQMLKDKGDELAKNLKEKYEQSEPIIREYVNKIMEIYKDILKVEDGIGK